MERKENRMFFKKLKVFLLKDKALKKNKFSFYCKCLVSINLRLANS